MSISNNDLITCIDNFIKEKQSVNVEQQQPNTIKKKELEAYLEEYAENNGISYKKQCEPVKTKYTFSIKNLTAEIEFYYRYSNYYTRHTITLK